MGAVRDFLRSSLWPARSSTPLTWEQYQSFFAFQGNKYTYGSGTSLGNKQERPSASFEGFVQGIYKSNGVVFACMAARMRLFSEMRFQYQRLRDGVPGELFGTDALRPLERPWPNGTTRDLNKRAIQDADIAGNFYATRRGQSIYRLRPDWVSIVLGSQLEPDHPELALDAEVLGYIYQPGGYAATAEPVVLMPEEVAHWAPNPDPAARFRGMSWLTPIIGDLMADDAATAHKLQFFEQGATVNLVINFDSPIIKTQEQFDEMVKAFRRGHEGTMNAYKTVFLAHGSDAKAIGADLVQSAFKEVQGAGETRIASVAGVPPIIVGLSEGLAAATYSNYGQARRAFSDLTMRPLWGDYAGAMSSIMDVPSDAQLWYDDRHISFLQEDVKDDAEIQQLQSQSIRTLLDAGFESKSVIAAVTSGDLSLLKHTGLFSVQLMPEGQPAANGNGNGAALPIGAADGG